jgi:hypothetical protein
VVVLDGLRATLLVLQLNRLLHLSLLAILEPLLFLKEQLKVLQKEPQL